MHDRIRNAFNPKFVHFASVSAADIATDGCLTRDGFARKVDEAIGAWYSSSPDCADASEESQSIRDLSIECLHKLDAPQVIRVDVWVEDLGRTSCTYGFICSDEDGATAFARGERVVVKIDTAHRPTEWSGHYREHHSLLMRDFLAYA